MASATPSRLGQVNKANDVLALFLKKFAGEILTAFEQTTIMLDKHIVRTIENGKSASFPATGRITSGYHQPGTEIAGTAVGHNEVIISIDELLVASAFLANIDEAMNHYDVRSIYSEEMGRQLATQFDKSVIVEGLKGAAAAETITGIGGGTSIALSTYTATNWENGTVTSAQKAAVIADALYSLRAAWDNDFKPSERYCLLRPQDYIHLAANKDAINADWGGSGSFATGDTIMIAGVKLISSPQFNAVVANLAQGSQYTTTGGSLYYHYGDFSKVRGLVFTKDAVGTVKLMDLATESAYDIRRQGSLFVAKYAMGHGYLRPECLTKFTVA